MYWTLREWSIGDHSRVSLSCLGRFMLLFPNTLWYYWYSFLNCFGLG
jgi:hypothetical protein